MKNASFTIVSPQTAYQADIFFESLQKFNPNIDSYGFWLGDENSIPQMLRDKKIFWLTAKDIITLSPLWHTLAFQYEVTALAEAVKPFLFEHLLKTYTGVIYFCPQTEIYHSLQMIENLLIDYNAILVPYITNPLQEENHLPHPPLQQKGQFDNSFLALSHSQSILDFIEEWKKNAITHVPFPKELENFSRPSLFPDLLLSLVDKIKILRDQGCNVSAFNFLTRRLQEENKSYWIANQPLIFCNFSHALLLEAEKNKPIHAFIDIFKNYQAQLAQKKQTSPVTLRYDFDFFSNGEPIFYADRRRYLMLHSWAKSHIGNPFHNITDIKKISTGVINLEAMQQLQMLDGIPSSHIQLFISLSKKFPRTFNHLYRAYTIVKKYRSKRILGIRENFIKKSIRKRKNPIFT